MSTMSFSAIFMLAALAPARAGAQAVPAPARPSCVTMPGAGPDLSPEGLAEGHPGSGADYVHNKVSCKAQPILHWAPSLKLQQRDPGPELLIVASNGGGDRARFVTLGVYDLMMKTQLWAAVDGLSTVSGSGAAAVAALAASAKKAKEAKEAKEAAARGIATAEPIYAVAPAGTEGIVTDHPAKGDIGLMIFNSAPAIQHWKTKRKVVPPFAREWARGGYAAGSATAGEPLWIPNASTIQAGQRVPLTTDTVRDPGGGVVSAARLLYLSSAVPGVMPPGEVKLYDGGTDGSSSAPTPRWLVDGAWADRWGVVTAVELALADWQQDLQNPPPTRSVLVVDSRPSPISDGLGATYTGKRLKVRAQLVGYSIEQTRLGTDAVAGEHVFGPSPCHKSPAPPSPVQRWEVKTPCPAPTDLLAKSTEKVLEHEGFGYYPVTYGANKDHARPTVPRYATIQATVERVGADTLLQSDLWDQPKQTEQCARTAARLYTVIATQPTDFSLRTPMLREGWREAGEDVQDGDGTYTTRFYPYGACGMIRPGKGEDCERDARAAALAMAGGFSLWLRMDAVRHTVTGVQPANTQAADAQAMWEMWEGLEGYMNWRSWQAYADFAICLQQGGLDGSKVSGHLDAAKGRDSWNGKKGESDTIGDPLLDSHTLRVPALHYTKVHPNPCLGNECNGYALPPIVRVKGGDGGEAKGAEKSDPTWSAVEYCVSPRLDPAKTLNDHFDAEGGPKTRRPDSDRQKDPKSCPDR